MNILHIKYAVEVANTGSINKASESLLIAQPNLSRSIKELESDLGITIFERTRKGMILTSEGREFIGYAKNILDQINMVEKMYKEDHIPKKKFSICTPRATYISEAFVQFSKNFRDSAIEVYYKETNPLKAIKLVSASEYKLGIIRYSVNYDKYFKTLFEEKGLHYEFLSEFSYNLLMGKESPLAVLDTITTEDISRYIEIAHADHYVPFVSKADVMHNELGSNINRRIFVFERCSQFELLSENPETFMWVSTVNEKTLERYGLVQRKCHYNDKKYKDMLIYRKDYVLSEFDKEFINELCKTKRKYF